LSGLLLAGFFAAARKAREVWCYVSIAAVFAQVLYAFMGTNAMSTSAGHSAVQSGLVLLIIPVNILAAWSLKRMERDPEKLRMILFLFAWYILLCGLFACKPYSLSALKENPTAA
jgi:hypothetical protein